MDKAVDGHHGDAQGGGDLGRGTQLDLAGRRRACGRELAGAPARLGAGDAAPLRGRRHPGRAVIRAAAQREFWSWPRAGSRRPGEVLADGGVARSPAPARVVIAGGRELGQGTRPLRAAGAGRVAPGPARSGICAHLGRAGARAPRCDEAPVRAAGRAARRVPVMTGCCAARRPGRRRGRRGRRGWHRRPAAGSPRGCSTSGFRHTRPRRR